MATNLVSREQQTTQFDAILVCNGNFHTPLWPQLESISQFQGRQLHSHDYRSPESFRKEIVLIISPVPSGIYIMRKITKSDEKVLWSNQLKHKMNIALPVNVVERPDVARLTHNKAVFVDDSFECCTTVVLLYWIQTLVPLFIDRMWLCGGELRSSVVLTLHIHSPTDIRHRRLTDCCVQQLNVRPKSQTVFKVP